MFGCNGPKGHINAVVGQPFGDGPYISDSAHCDYAIWAPANRGEVVNEAFSLYAMECEGDTTTRRGKINKVIKLMVAAGPMRNDFATQCDIYDEVGIDSDTFTDQEVEYIESEVAKRVYGY
jgi:hypothetical protein